MILNTNPSREQCTFGMTGCTGGWTSNHAVLQSISWFTSDTKKQLTKMAWRSHEEKKRGVTTRFNLSIYQFIKKSTLTLLLTSVSFTKLTCHSERGTSGLFWQCFILRFYFSFLLINCWSSVVASVVLPQLCNLHCLFFLFEKLNTAPHGHHLHRW